MDEIGKIENGENGRNGESRESGKTGNGEIWHIEDIARLTGRSIKRIRCMRSATPDALPPAFTLPGSQRLCWLPGPVLDSRACRSSGRLHHAASDRKSTVDRPPGWTSAKKCSGLTRRIFLLQKKGILT